MKTQKNKIVFVLVLACMVLFITIHSIVTFGKPKKESLDVGRIPMPDLEDTSVEFETKLEAVEAIKVEKQSTAPQVYPDHMVDDKGYFNPDYMEYEKQRIIDSVFDTNAFTAKKVSVSDAGVMPRLGTVKKVKVDDEKLTMGSPRTETELGLVHQLFFASNPKRNRSDGNLPTTAVAKVYVDGDQTLRDGQRLDLRLAHDYVVDGKRMPGGTRLYGFVKIRPNRVMVELTRLGTTLMDMQAYDAQDGQEGIYVKNHLRGEVVDRSLDEGLGEINVPGVPQFNGIKRIFQRDQRTVKVQISDHYQFFLIPRS